MLVLNNVILTRLVYTLQRHWVYRMGILWEHWYEVKRIIPLMKITIFRIILLCFLLTLKNAFRV